MRIKKLAHNRRLARSGQQDNEKSTREAYLVETTGKSPYLLFFFKGTDTH
jgi:hypothetical protein